jgi:SAM-dependent methyltransferase
MRYYIDKLQKAYKHGLVKVLIGQAKKRVYYLLYIIYHFDKWHFARPFETTNYKQMIVKIIDPILEKGSTVVDVGCGTGQILRHIGRSRRIGIDLDKQALQCGELFNKFINPSIEYLEGSIAKVSELNTPVKVLILTNWLHAYDDNWITENLCQLFKSSMVENCLVDEVLTQKDRIKNIFSKFGTVIITENDWQDKKNIFLFKIDSPYTGARAVCA